MIHEINTSSFHGYVSFRLRGPKDGFILSEKQAKKYLNALCGISECKCGGGYRQSEPDSGARIEIISQDNDGCTYELIPEFKVLEEKKSNRLATERENELIELAYQEEIAAERKNASENA